MTFYGVTLWGGALVFPVLVESANTVSAVVSETENAGGFPEREVSIRKILAYRDPESSGRYVGDARWLAKALVYAAGRGKQPVTLRAGYPANAAVRSGWYGVDERQILIVSRLEEATVVLFLPSDPRPLRESRLAEIRAAWDSTRIESLSVNGTSGALVWRQ